MLDELHLAAWGGCTVQVFRANNAPNDRLGIALLQFTKFLYCDERTRSSLEVFIVHGQLDLLSGLLFLV